MLHIKTAAYIEKKTVLGLSLFVKLAFSFLNILKCCDIIYYIMLTKHKLNQFSTSFRGLNEIQTTNSISL